MTKLNNNSFSCRLCTDLPVYTIPTSSDCVKLEPKSKLPIAATSYYYLSQITVGAS